MRHWIAGLLLLVVLGVPTGCKEPVGPPPAPSPPDQANLLALLDPEGNSKLDGQLRELQARAQRTPRKPEVWVELGQAWIRKARGDGKALAYRSADACAELALRLAPGDPLATDLRGLTLLNDHRFEDARRIARALVDRQPDHAPAWGTLSDALLELGRYDEAVEAAQRMMAVKPNLPSYARASYLMWLRGDSTRAKELARLAMDAGRDQRDPEPLAWVTVQAAMLFWHEGDHEGADAGFDRALAVKPGFAPALVGKARVALAQGQPSAAAALLQDALAASPLGETAALLADARRFAGDQAGAAAAEEEVFRHGREGDRRTLSLYLSTHGRDPDRALELAESERKVRQDLYTEDALAWALYRKGRLSEARAAIDRALVLGTPDARLLYHAGAIRLAAGDRAGGMALVKRALALNPGFDPTGSAEAQTLSTQR